MKMLIFRYPRNAVTDILVSLLCMFVIALILINAEYRYDVYCSNENDIISQFLADNGWIADVGAGSCEEKLIPDVFDDTYKQYSVLQEKQGFSLEKYKGRKVTVCSFPLRNYPGYEGSDNVFINLMLCDGRIIGADILCTSINGFITGAVRNGNTET